jgi:ABC-type antimicrobial peptide transport system permease subunit
LSRWFSGFAIFISCLGLVGVSLFLIERKAKEISIRKIVGASVVNLFYIISKEFILLILISITLAIPAGYYLMNKWLTGFAYKIDLEWTVFLMAGIAVFTIAFSAIGYQAIKAAIANPIQSLRSE